MTEAKNKIIRRLTSEVNVAIDSAIDDGTLKRAEDFLKRWLPTKAYKIWQRTEKGLVTICSAEIARYFNNRIIFCIMMKKKCEEAGITFDIIDPNEFIIHALFNVILYMKFDEKPDGILIGGYAV